MAINKFTRPSFSRDPALQANALTLYGQRVGEPGLSNELHISFNGFTGEERAAILDLIDQALQARIESMGAIA